MNNSDLLTFDYTQPVSALPHDYYILYIKDKEFSYSWSKPYKKTEVYQLPHDLDSFYYPESCYFLVVGKSRANGDEVLDGGNILQETNRYVKRRIKKYETMNDKYNN